MASPSSPCGKRDQPAGEDYARRSMPTWLPGEEHQMRVDVHMTRTRSIVNNPSAKPEVGNGASIVIHDINHPIRAEHVELVMVSYLDSATPTTSPIYMPAIAGGSWGRRESHPASHDRIRLAAETES